MEARAFGRSEGKCNKIREWFYSFKSEKPGTKEKSEQLGITKTTLNIWMKKCIAADDFPPVDGEFKWKGSSDYEKCIKIRECMYSDKNLCCL